MGVVLGGGGFPAMAYHAGTLLAIEVDTGWNPASADVIVGTSAGSVVAALVSVGMTIEDLAAWTSQVRPGDSGSRIRSCINRVERTGLRLKPPVVHGAGRPRLRSSALLSLAGIGVLDGRAALDEIAELFDGWPSRLLVPAVRASDGERVVFGRDRRPAVTEALAASSAIPGVFRPVDIDGDYYVDGGVRSPTNADLLIEQQVDVALVLSPMTPRPHASTGLLPSPRRNARRQLDRELRALDAAGIETLTFEPDRATARAAGRNSLSRRALGSVAQRAFLSAFDRDRSSKQPAATIAGRSPSSSQLLHLLASRPIAATPRAASPPPANGQCIVGGCPDGGG